MGQIIFCVLSSRHAYTLSQNSKGIEHILTCVKATTTLLVQGTKTQKGHHAARNPWLPAYHMLLKFLSAFLKLILFTFKSVEHILLNKTQFVWKEKGRTVIWCTVQPVFPTDSLCLRKVLFFFFFALSFIHSFFLFFFFWKIIAGPLYSHYNLAYEISNLLASDWNENARPHSECCDPAPLFCKAALAPVASVRVLTSFFVFSRLYSTKEKRRINYSKYPFRS